MQTFNDSGCVDEVTLTQYADEVLVQSRDVQTLCAMHFSAKKNTISDITTLHRY